MDIHAPESADLVLERLEAAIQDALHRLIDGGRIDDGHRASADGFRRRLANLRKRLHASRGSTSRIELPADAKTDFDLLVWDYKRWLAEIDAAFEDRIPAQPVFQRGVPG